MWGMERGLVESIFKISIFMGALAISAKNRNVPIE